MKKVVVAVLLTITMAFTFAPKINADSTIKMWVDGRYLASSESPYIEGGTTMVPLRFISERIGFDVKYDERLKQIIIIGNDTRIAMAKNNKNVMVNGKFMALDKPPTIKNGRTYVPLRAIAEMMGKNVDWDGEKRTVIIGINYPKFDKDQKEKMIEPKEALRLAKSTSSGEVTAFELDGKKYKVEIEDREKEYKYVINAYTGEIEKFDEQENKDIEDNFYFSEDEFSEKNPKNRKLSTEEAQKIALQNANGKILETEYDESKRVYRIKVQIRYEKHKYEVDAKTGELKEI